MSWSAGLNRVRPNRARGGFIVGALFFLLVIAALAVLAWIIVLPRVVTSSVSQVSGCDTTISQLHVNPFTGRFEATGVRLANPPGWGEDALVEVPLLTGRLDLGSLLSETVIIPEARIDVTRLLIVVDAAGKTNFEALGPSSASTGVNPDKFAHYATAGFPSMGSGPSSVVIGRLDLRIDRIELVDLGVQPAKILIDEINYQHTYTNLSDYKQLLTPQLMAKFAKSPALWQVLIANGLLGADAEGAGGLQQLWNRAQGAVNSFLQGLEQTEKP